MGTLKSCSLEFRKSLPAADLARMKTLQAQHVAAGLSPQDAALKANDDIEQGYLAARTQINTQVQEAGGVADQLDNQKPTTQKTLEKTDTPPGPLPVSEPQVRGEKRKGDAKTAKDEAKKSARAKESRAAKTLKKFWREQMSTMGGLPEKVFARKIVRDNNIGAHELHTAHLMIDFDRAVKKAYPKKPTAQQTAQINNYLAGQDTDIPASVKTAIEPMRAYLDALSGKMISEGVVDLDSKVAQTILENLGSYLTRSYRAFDDTNWPDKVSEETKQNAFDFIKGQLPKDQQSAKDVDDLVWGTVNNILQEGTAADHMGALVTQGKLGAKDLSILIKRKQIAPEIRELLGEYKDPRVNFVRSSTKMSFAIANHQLLNEIRAEGIGEFLFTEPRGEFSVRIAAKTSDTMAPLNGLYTTPETKIAFEQALEKEHMSDFFRAIVGLNSLVKYGKVVLAPTTQARNFMSAFFFSVANGHLASPQRLRVATKTISGELRGKKEQRAYMLKLKRLGVVHDNPRAGELMSALKDFSQDGGRMDAILGGKPRKAFDFLTRLYQAGDDFHKVIGFEAEKDMLMKHKGLDEKEAEIQAAQRVRDTYPTYSLVSRGIKKLRRFPLMGTFVSFPAEIVRTSINIVKLLKADLLDPDLRALARQRGAGLLLAGGWSLALSQFTMSLMGLDDDDDEAVKELAPPWQRNSQLAYTGFDDDGNLQYQDLTYANPYAYLTRPISALLKDEPADELLLDALKEIAEPFLGPDIAAAALGEVLFNTRISGGRVYNPSDLPTKQAADIGDYLRRSLQPGVVSNMERTLMALQNKTTRTGRKFTVKDEMLALVGFRTTTVDPKTSLLNRGFEFNDSISDATQILSRLMGDQNKLSEDKIKNAFGRMVRARRKAWDDMDGLVNAARKMGLEDIQMARIINSAGVSKRDATALVRGRFVPWTPSKQFLQNAQRRARETSTPKRWQELKVEFRQRQALIVELTKENMRTSRGE